MVLSSLVVFCVSIEIRALVVASMKHSILRTHEVPTYSLAVLTALNIFAMLWYGVQQEGAPIVAPVLRDTRVGGDTGGRPILPQLYEALPTDVNGGMSVCRTLVKVDDRSTGDGMTLGHGNA
jgi:hypothetical protein